MGVEYEILHGGNMEKVKSNKKKIIISVAIVIGVLLIASIFIDVSFTGTPLESKKVVGTLEYSSGINETELKIFHFEDLEDFENFEILEWPENPKHPFYSFRGEETNYLISTNYIVKMSNVGIDVLDLETREAKNIYVKNDFSGGSLKLSIFLTENEIVFSAYEVDIKGIVTKSEENGTYKYNLESGKMEKICGGTFRNLTVVNNHLLLGTYYWWEIPKIVFIF